jgi:phage-related protein
MPVGSRSRVWKSKFFKRRRRIVSPAPPSNSTLSGSTTPARPFSASTVMMCWRKLSCLLDVVTAPTAAGIDLLRFTAKPVSTEILSISCIFSCHLPVGVPLCRALGNGLWEVRSQLTQGRISRVLFSIHDGRMVLLHAFIKKTQKTPDADLALALKRKKEVT